MVNTLIYFFQLLLTVSGVGPKTAFSVISFLKVEEITKSVFDNNVDILTRVPSLGKKTAMKIILELSSKLKTSFDMKNMVLSDDDKTVIEALISLGYKSYDAKKILSKLPKNLSVEEKIKQALKKSKTPWQKIGNRISLKLISNFLKYLWQKEK